MTTKKKFKQRRFPYVENEQLNENFKKFSVIEEDNCFGGEARLRQEILFVG